MTSEDVKDLLRAVRGTHSVGSVLSLLAEVVQEEADAEFGAGDLTAEEQSRLCVSALFAVGLGLDAIRRSTGSV